VVLGAARRRMTDALSGPESVLVVGSTQETRALAEHLAEGYAVTFVTDRTDLVEQADDRIVAREVPLSDGGALGELDLSADAAVVAAARDRTNLFVAQILEARGEVDRVVVRVNDPDRRELFSALGAETVCPTDVLAPAFESALEEA